MFEYMTVQEAAKKWELSERRIQKLCAENRIDGVVHLSRVWLIPKNAEKPADGRKKKIKMFRCNIWRTFTCYTICKKQRK